MATPAPAASSGGKAARKNWLIRLILGTTIAVAIIGFSATFALRKHDDHLATLAGNPPASQSQAIGGMSTAPVVSTEITKVDRVDVPGSDSAGESKDIVVADGKRLCTEPLNATITYRPTSYTDDAPEHWFVLPSGGQAMANAYRYKGREPGPHSMRTCQVAYNAECPQRCPDA